MGNRRCRERPPALWGGVECTVNRVGDVYYDQMELSGHTRRIEDQDLFIGLGVHALRYPLQWERLAPTREETDRDWTWADAGLNRLREAGVTPVVGLLHHGSGPAYTSLVDSGFADGLGHYASEVVRRYPWVEMWTPVNEPLTTARFSGLYGHWYPHGKDEPTFVRALVNQCRGVALAMQAIREENPAARLVQTEDLGKTYSTARLQYQADFENERRWLSWDLLSGLVDRHHPLWQHLLWAGIGELELGYFLDHPCPPDIVGVNYYLTSERFLDERPYCYPATCYGSNGRDRYADVEAVRVLSCEIQGPRGAISEAWQRYKRPLAITEAHLGCTREEQMRWLQEVWESAVSLRQEGVDIVAVTAWALLGSYDWNSMLTRFEGHYESGVFDVRGGTARPTALAAQIKALAQGKRPDHPVLATAGWWRRQKRVLYDPSCVPPSEKAAGFPRPMCLRRKAERPVLIAGADTTLGAAFACLCDHRHLAHVAAPNQDMDITDFASVQAALKRHRPWALIHAAGYLPVTGTPCSLEVDPVETAAGAALLATLCAQHRIPMLALSSNMVFNGNKREPYVESDTCNPINPHGISEARAESCVREILPSALVVRTGPLFSPWDGHNFVSRMLQYMAEGKIYTAIDDVFVSPTYIPDLVHACLDLLIDGEQGLWHLANRGAVTWLEMARMVAGLAGFDASLVEGRPLRAVKLPVAWPRYSVLGSAHGPLLPSLETALECYFQDSDKGGPGLVDG